MARVMAEGLTNHQEGGWRNVPLKVHLNHALVHLFAHLAEDDQDDHLDHALCRLMMAVDIQHMEREFADGED
jgi:hypothetical protein